MIMKKGKGKNSGLLPSSLRIISSCLKTVSTNASTVASTVRSAGASVAASISAAAEDHKDQITWAGFDTLELDLSVIKRVLLLGYTNGFQVLDVDDASSFSELVSKRDGPVSFLQMQPFPIGPIGSDGKEGFKKSHPLLLVVAGDDTGSINQNSTHLSSLGRDGKVEIQSGTSVNFATAVRFYSLKSHSYVHVLRFRSAVRMIRCSSKIVAVGLATQIYCFDASTLENKFSVLTYPIPQLSGQGTLGVNVGYGPMSVGPRWLAYASNSPLPSNAGCLSPQNQSPSPGVSPSTSPGSGSLVARYAMESSRNFAAGIIKYCHELLPDSNSSPVVTGIEMDKAGTVIVRDFVSKAIISQFKAHSSPISALCFDPSGTLLVTASIYGNNINIFRIMPSFTRKGSGLASYDCSSSHVQLYRLHRGITPAMIQDICFSHFSQWIAIVSSKGTCHLFVLSPFGGDTGFQIINSQSEEPSLLPILSLPWWSTSSSFSYQQSMPPPAPVALSVVSRIKYSSFGWLNTVNSSTANVTGKVFVPSGAIAATFHNSLSHKQLANSKMKPLEHLLVYTPSGHVVQHELLPSVGPDPSESGSRAQSASIMHIQEDEFRVKVEPIQWWDVCRRSEWPERGGPYGNTFDRQDGVDRVQEKICSGDGYGSDFLDISDDAGEKKAKSYTGKPQDMFHWYLSNAEVQLNFGKLPIWQKSKICFYTMNSVRPNSSASGESEIEKISANEVEIRRKELLPFFDHFNSTRPNWNERSLHPGGKYFSPAYPFPNQAEDKQTADITVICHSMPTSLSSTESSEGGSSRRIENLLDLDQVSCQVLGEMYLERMGPIHIEPSLQNNIESENSSISGNLKHVDSQYENRLNADLLMQEIKIDSKGRDLVGVSINEGSTLIMNKHAVVISEHVDVDSEMQNACLTQSFLDGHCKTLGRDGSHALTEVGTDDVDSSSSHHEREQHEEDGANDEIIGDFFAFSE